MRAPEEKKAVIQGFRTLAVQLQEDPDPVLEEQVAALGRRLSTNGGEFHEYSWKNTLMVYVQRPGATCIAGFRTWKKAGRSVRKGEKGLMIWVPIVVEKKEDEDGEVLDEGKVRFRIGYVFDLSQTEEAKPGGNGRGRRPLVMPV